MSYVLIVTIVNLTIGTADVQREYGFVSYEDCATHAVAKVEADRPLYPGTDIKWECEKE